MSSLNLARISSMVVEALRAGDNFCARKTTSQASPISSFRMIPPASILSKISGLFDIVYRVLAYVKLRRVLAFGSTRSNFIFSQVINVPAIPSHQSSNPVQHHRLHLPQRYPSREIPLCLELLYWSHW